MKRFILYILKTVVCVILIMTTLLVSLICYPRDVFCDTYQSVIQRKYDTLLQTNEPKIIIIGGSSAAFGINEALLEEQTGYKVVNLGLHAGFGAIVPTELSKANINEGDIVLLAYEWGWHRYGYFDSLGTDLVMSGFDHRIDMYRWLPVKQYSKILGYLFQFAELKRTHQKTASGTYSSSSFDADGRMTLARPKLVMEYEGNEAIFTSINVSDSELSKDVITYLNNFKEFVHKNNAQLYFISPPYYSGACTSTEEDFSFIAEQTEEILGIEYISDPADYAFPAELMYDTIYHCNEAGELHRTELLINDLNNAGIIPSNN